MKISCQILTKNNERSILRALNSIQLYVDEVIVCDLGSTDSTQDICLLNKVKYYDCKNTTNLSKLRNDFVAEAKNNWIMVLEPWEIFTNPEILNNINESDPNVYNVTIMQNNILTYEDRIWHKSLELNFKNPVYEFLDIKKNKSNHINGLIYGDDTRDVVDLLELWVKDEPNSNEALYYEALYCLSQQKWEHFTNKAYKYLFNNKKNTKANIMMNYYYAIVMCHIKKDTSQALNHTLGCLAIKPLMSEFWCLLGDIHYHRLSNYKKAKTFYKNAITLGAWRMDSDGWPTEIKKYVEYPKNMISKCEEMISKSKKIITRK